MTSYYNEVLGKFLSDSKWDHFNKAYASLFLKSSTEPLQENTEYMELTELKFILKNWSFDYYYYDDDDNDDNDDDDANYS
eukprot:scaffold453_cov187-Ochromonas_danica.AAC.15